MLKQFITSIDYEKLIKMQANREFPQYNGSIFSDSKISTKTETKPKMKTFLLKSSRKTR